MVAAALYWCIIKPYSVEHAFTLIPRYGLCMMPLLTEYKKFPFINGIFRSGATFLLFAILGHTLA